MKNFIYLCMSVFLFIACSTDSSFEDEELASKTLEETTTLSSRSSTTARNCSENFLNPVLYGQYQADGNCNNYYSYVSTNTAMSYSRSISVIYFTTDDNDIIETKIFTLPANAYVSQTVRVFQNASEDYEDVSLRIVHVADNNGLTDTCNVPRELNFNVNNCFTAPGPTGPSIQDAIEGEPCHTPDCSSYGDGGG